MVELTEATKIQYPFEQAMSLLKSGAKIARSGWNGKGMWLIYAYGGIAKTPFGSEYGLLPFVVMRTAQGDFVPWLASQTDLLSDDWVLV